MVPTIPRKNIMTLELLYGESKTAKAVHAFLERRKRLCSKPMICPNCKSRQVQLVEYLHPPARWKCRSCKFKFVYEPIIKVECK